MKIAILTQPLGKNYGGIMQAWALQKVLERMGHQPVTIDRQHNQPSKLHIAVRTGYRIASKLAGHRKAPVNFEKHLPTIQQHTRNFVDQNLTMSEQIFCTKQLKQHFDRESYGAVIVGSDQTWRPKYSPNIYDFYLEFLNKKNILRIAYASSFGTNEWEYDSGQMKRCASLAKKFNAISVRERGGQLLCKKFLGVEANLTLDPTLLLPRERYLDIIGGHRLAPKPYGIYTYFLENSSDKLEIANKVSEIINEETYSCQPNSSIDHDESDIYKQILPPVEQWQSGFANAKFVLTDSFHGMVFAIKYQKPFAVIGNAARGMDRFVSLLDLLGLSHRLVRNDKDIYKVRTDSEDLINLTELNSLQEQSLNFLTRSGI